MAFCMTENSDLPIIAEAKEPARPSNQVIALRNEIIGYAKEQILFSEQIAEQKLAITTLTDNLHNLTNELSLERSKVFGLELEISSKEAEIRNLQREIEMLENRLDIRSKAAERYEKMIIDLNNIIRNTK